jgi:hypothetical protein
VIRRFGLVTGMGMLLAMSMVGCAQGEADQTPMAKEPDVTAEQARERLNNSNIPENAKRVMGGNIKDPEKSGSQQ